MKNFIRKYFKLVCISLIVILFFTMAMSLTLGASDVSFRDSIALLLSKIPFLNNFVDKSNIKDTTEIILMNIRMPRIIMASLVGCILSVVGGTFQGMFRNPMADPFVLGMSSGASLGATIAIILGLDKYIFGVGMVNVLAFLFSILTVFLAYNISKVGRKVPTMNLLLSGIAISFFMSAMVSLIMILNRNQMEKIIFWTMGSLSSASWKNVIALLVVSVIGIGINLIFSKDLNIMTLGEDSAINLGVDIEKVKRILIVVCAMMVSFAVSSTGVIGFVGLIVPHVVRIISGPDYKKLTILSSIVGAIFLVLCDTLSRIIAPPMEIPVGVITSFLGAPFFIYLLNKGKKRGL